MEAYKLTLAFDNLNKVVDFYRTELKKSEEKTMATITSMGTKGQITCNPDDSISVTWFFRTMPKYDKFADAYLRYTHIPDVYIPQPRKTYAEMVSLES